jgi:tetratricopeptide (TPR) repeat protein
MQCNKTERAVCFLLCISFGCICAPAFSQKTVAEPGPSKSGSSRYVSALAAAKAEISKGELSAAEEKLWTVLSSHPNQSEALTLLGIIRGRQKRYAEGEALLRRVVQLDPKSVAAHRNLANALSAQNKRDEAIAEYAEVVKLSPHDNRARIDLARLYLARGRFAEALSTLEAIPPAQFPGDATPAKAATLLGLGRTKEAGALIPRAERSPASAAEMAEVFLDGNAPQYALQIVHDILQRAPRPPALIYTLKGRAQFATGDRAGALKSLREALIRDPKSVDSLLLMAEIHASEGEHAESLELLKRANAQQGNSPTILRPLVIEAMKAGEVNTASRAGRLLADSAAENVDDQYLAAAAMLEGKDFATASSIFAKYVIVRPEDGKGFLGLGIAELAQQHDAEARKALERALQIDPQLADAEYQLAIVADHQSATTEELHHLERTIQLQPDHAKALAKLGRQYLQTGDVEKADAVLERSVASDPNNSQSQYDLALVLAKMGKTEEAKQHMARSAALKAEEDAGKKPIAAASHP